MRPFRRLRPAAGAAGLLACLVISGCAAWQSHRDGHALVARGEHEAGLVKLEEASRQEPDNLRYRHDVQVQRDALLQQLLAQAFDALDADQPAAARGPLDRAAALQPASARVAAGRAKMEALERHLPALTRAAQWMNEGRYAEASDLVSAALRELPGHRRAITLARQIAVAERDRSGRIDGVSPKLKAAYRRPASLSFRDSTLLQVFEALKLASGINFIFDRDVKTDTRLTLAVQGKPMEDLLRVILAGQRLATRILDEDTILVYPNTPEKTRDYQELVIRTFYLGNAEAARIAGLVRTVVKARDVFVDDKLNLLVVRDTPEVVRLAERVIANADVAEPEVMLELEVLEVSLNRLTELGIRFPDSISAGVQGSLGAGQLTLPEFQNRNSSLVNLAFNDPLITANLRRTVGDTNVLANPRIRIKNRNNARVLIGERVPVITTTTTANVGTSESVNYLDVGLKLDLEPVVSLDDEVSMKVALEVSSITGTVTRASGLQAFRLGTRNANTTLRVRDGETQILAGLIQRDERQTSARVPGLGDLPVVGRLFSNTSDNQSRTEIVLLITPRVVRNLTVPGPERLEIVAGTDASNAASSMNMAPAAGVQGAVPRPAANAPSTVYPPGVPIPPGPMVPASPASTVTQPTTPWPSPAQPTGPSSGPSFSPPPLIPSSPGSSLPLDAPRSETTGTAQVPAPAATLR